MSSLRLSSSSLKSIGQSLTGLHCIPAGVLTKPRRSTSEDYNRFKNRFVIKSTISDRKLVEFPKNYKCHGAASHESFEPFLEELMQTDSTFLSVNPLSRLEGKRYNDSTLNKLWSAACEKYDVSISLYNGLKHSTLDHYYNVLGVPLTDLLDLTGHKNLDCIKHYDRMKIRLQKSLLALEKDAPHLKLMEGGKEVNSHKIVTKRKIDELKPPDFQ